MIARSAGSDLVTGDGLDAALAGVDAVIDATNTTSSGKRGSSQFFKATARTLMRSADAGVTVSRMVLDVLRSARVRRADYVRPWLPQPVVVSPDEIAADPAHRVTLADEVGYALLVVMENLSPAERTAFVLHDLFGLTFEEVTAIVGRAPGAVSQLASRARRRVREESPWPPTGGAESKRVVEAFALAAATGDLGALIHVLDPDMVLVSDGGGLVRSARKPVLGADRVARFLLGMRPVALQD